MSAERSTYVNVVNNLDASRESITRREGLGYDVLAEVNLILENLKPHEGGWELDPEITAYVRENEVTAACEAVDSGGSVWTATRQWNGTEYLAFGEMTMNQLMQSGIDAVHPDSFEYQRRLVEAEIEKDINRARMRGDIENCILMTVSPYPEEELSDVAASYGYKPDEKLAKLRFEVFTNNIRTTVEVSVANSSNVILGQILGLEPEQASSFHSNDLLGLTRNLGPVESETYLEIILEKVKEYDQFLLKETGQRHQFGLQVEDEELSYQANLEKRLWVTKQGRSLVERLYNLDHELALSLKNSQPTDKIRQKIYYWSSFQVNGESLLSSEKLRVLRSTVLENTFSTQAAEIIKHNELVRVWTALASQLNPEIIDSLLGNKLRQEIDAAVEKEEFSDELWQRIDRAISTAETELHFRLCGGSLSGYRNLFNAPLTSVMELLFGGEGFNCPNCDKYLPSGNGDVCRKEKGGCGMTKDQWAEKSGTKCA